MPGFAQYGYRGGEMMGYGYHPWLGAGVGIFLFVLAVILIGLLVWTLAHRRRVPGAGTAPGSLGTPPPPTIAQDDALRIARERLARGEIDVEQYTAIAEALRG